MDQFHYLKSDLDQLWHPMSDTDQIRPPETSLGVGLGLEVRVHIVGVEIHIVDGRIASVPVDG